PWRFPSLLHARGETTGVATQRSRPSVLHLRTGVRIPPPPDFARPSGELRLGRPCLYLGGCLAQSTRALHDAKSVTPKPGGRRRTSSLLGFAELRLGRPPVAEAKDIS